MLQKKLTALSSDVFTMEFELVEICVSQVMNDEVDRLRLMVLSIDSHDDVSEYYQMEKSLQLYDTTCYTRRL